VVTLAVLGALAVMLATRSRKDLKTLAREVEQSHPELDGRLLTAVRNDAPRIGGSSYFNERLVRELLTHDRVRRWSAAVPARRLQIAHAAQWLGLLLLVAIVWQLPAPNLSMQSTRLVYAPGVTVSPGDTSLEAGSSLVVLARFGGAPPAHVELVLGSGSEAKRVPLVKSLADPMFGGSVTDIRSNLVYYVTYDGKKTREFKVGVYEHPRLEQADASLVFPAYTGQQPMRIENTRRVSGVEGSLLDLSLRLNKPVRSAVLVSRDRAAPGRVELDVATNGPAAFLRGFAMRLSGSYDLRLIDADGRTNKLQAQFNLNVLTNRAPELRLASPRGDLRPSPLEEIRFEGTVWDDFGVPAFGVGYMVAGEPTKWVELGQEVPAKDKRSFEHLLRLEELNVRPDQLVCWFVWAEDVGPEGEPRRTTGDLFFGEVRPFDEIFREGQGMDGQQQQGGEQGGEQQQSPSRKLAELQKQIINATWRLQREQMMKGSPGRASPTNTEENKGKSEVRSSRFEVPAPNPESISKSSVQGVSLGPSWSLPRILGAPATENHPPQQGGARSETPKTPAGPISSDADVIRESQGEALSQAKSAASRQTDPRSTALWRAAIQDMEKALARLKASAPSSTEYTEALAAQQAAYQSLLKLQEHEYQVNRSRQQSQGGAGNNSGDQMQRQLEQMEMTQSENRYETQRQASRPQASERREDLQVLNRLQELARRQQDLNEKLKELQSALQEAKTEQEREELRRRLKRLQEEEQQMLADVDELKQRMERPENQSRMSEQREQLERTREDIRRAAEAAEQGSASQALAAGTRAQSQLQEMREDLRRENSSQFSEDLREMRNQARELARQQEELLSKLGQPAPGERQSLSDSEEKSEMMRRLAQQNERLTNLVGRATQISEEAEATEPLLSRQLHDSVRKLAQDTARDVNELQDQWLRRGTITRSLMERLRDPGQSDGSKLLDATAEMLRLDLESQAVDASERARQGFDTFRQGVERAANNVLGDDTEALRLASQELESLSEQLAREAGAAPNGTNEVASFGKTGGQPRDNAEAGSLGQRSANSELTEAAAQGGSELSEEAANDAGESSEQAQLAQANQPNESAETQAENGQQRGSGGQSQGEQQDQQGQTGRQQIGASQRQQTQTGQGSTTSESESQSPEAQPGNQARQANNRNSSSRTGRLSNSAAGGGDEGGDISGSLQRALDGILNQRPDTQAGPITGEEFVPWSDRLRDVEQMIEIPDLRNDVARVRERARQLRQEFTRERKKPDWAVVRLQLMEPLAEVRDKLEEELARRESPEALVPIDRDPVPGQYSELVRRYYETLGKDR
jgi:hypothetical protein